MSVRQWRVTDLYAVLGVSPNASEDEIDTAFRELAKRWHPDRCGGDPVAAERFKRITAAHNVIGDPSTRARYDHERALAETTPPARVGPARAAGAGTPTGPSGRAPRAARPASWADPESWGGSQAAWEPARPAPGRARPLVPAFGGAGSGPDAVPGRVGRGRDGRLRRAVAGEG
ncbi:MAG TPA: DnaJ domain-containing protein, partial [Acidimicrobiia bacterium]|nr:DnaJ domain-containing protein [Acidimicrobiia bacterium]